MLPFLEEETPPGLTSAIQLRTPLLRRIQAELELIQKVQKELSQVLASTARDSPRKRVRN